MYARSREDAADTLADEIREIGQRVECGDLDPSAGRVAADIKKWAASKLKPRAYGDRLELAGKVGTTTDLVDQAPDWLKAAIKEKAAEAAAEQEAGAPAAQGDGDGTAPEGSTVH